MEDFHPKYFIQQQDKNLYSDPTDHNCYRDDKDDFNENSRKTFIALFFVTLAVGSLLAYNGYLMIKTNRVPKNVPLTMFLGCATATIIGKFQAI